MKAWSISTTVRNPDRIPDFTAAIEAIAGEVWTKETQVALMHELIRRRLYKPNNLSEVQKTIFEDSEYEMSTSEAKEIFDSQDYKDPPMRGRTAIAPVRDMGLVRLKPVVALTHLGQALVKGDITLQDALLNYSLKWEVPTPEHTTFKAEEGYRIKPFAGTLALITKVNELWAAAGKDPVGLSRDEFNFYGPTLIDYKYIDEFAQRIISSRTAIRGAEGAAAKEKAKVSSIQSHLSNLPHNTEPVSDTDKNNLGDYGDNAIRYFRNTGFIEFRGMGRFVDIATASKAQVQLLVDQELYKPISYSTADEYLDAMGDVESFTPPWATSEKKEEIKKYLVELLAKEGGEVATSITAPAARVSPIRGEDAEIVELKDALLRSRLSKLKTASRTSTFIDSFIDEYSNLPKKNYDGYLPKPVALEFNTFKAFLSLNDALKVKPNYPLGDDGEPISTAPGGGTDLFCEYDRFVLSVEVSMSTGRSQWMMEGQPVQRHLRDIEEATEKPAFSLFLAPKLHEDTVNTFWVANVVGYQGKQQQIIPLEFEFWSQYLVKVRSRIESGELKHVEIMKFLQSALPVDGELSDSVAWYRRINSSSFLEKLAAA
jgi:hypothetical protein